MSLVTASRPWAWNRQLGTVASKQSAGEIAATIGTGASPLDVREFRVAPDMSRAVRCGTGGVKDAVVGDERERGVEVVCRPGGAECLYDGQRVVDLSRRRRIREDDAMETLLVRGAVRRDAYDAFVATSTIYNSARQSAGLPVYRRLVETAVGDDALVVFICEFSDRAEMERADEALETNAELQAAVAAMYEHLVPDSVTASTMRDVE